MQLVTTVTQKGQATIPAPIRKKLGIRPKTKVIFGLEDVNKAFLRIIPDFFSFKGSVKTRKPFDVDAMDKAVKKQIAREYAKTNY